MAYTPSSAKTKTTSGIFSNQPVDGGRVSMGYANSIQSQDDTATPVTSPVTNMSNSGAALTVPPNAVRLTINSTVAILVGEDASYAQGINVPANTLFSIDCADMANVYLKPSSATSTVSFIFNIV
jgi:hypothetical protein